MATKKPAKKIFTIRHAGIGEVVRTAHGVELRLHSNAAQARAAGVPDTLIAKLFSITLPKPPDACTARYTPTKPKGLEDYLPEHTVISCDDTGCTKGGGIGCHVISLPKVRPKPPLPDPQRDEGPSAPMDDERFYYCSCEYAR